MPLSVWIAAVVDGETSQIKNFTDVYMDFCQAIGGKEMEIRMEQLKDITALQTKIKVAELCINMLRLKPSKEVYDSLYGLGYQTSVHEYDKDRIEEAIKQMQPYINLDIVDLQMLLNRVNKSKGGEYTRDYFTTMLVNMGIAFKMSIPETITLRTYCAYVVRYKDYVDMMNKQNEKQ